MTDLDARVAALMQRLRACRYDPMWASHAEINKGTLQEAMNVITELQKPALHEPVTAEEAIKAFAVYATQYGNVEKAMKAALESFLQGRAKPAQEEITDEQIDTVFHAMAGVNEFGVPYLRTYKEGFRTIARKVIRASKGEKT